MQAGGQRNTWHDREGLTLHLRWTAPCHSRYKGWSSPQSEWASAQHDHICSGLTNAVGHCPCISRLCFCSAIGTLVQFVKCGVCNVKADWNNKTCQGTAAYHISLHRKAQDREDWRTPSENLQQGTWLADWEACSQWMERRHTAMTGHIER